MNKKLTEMVDFILRNPYIIKDICYRDEAITLWKRDMIIERKDGFSFIYHCRDCGTKRHYKNGLEYSPREEMKSE